MLANTQPKKSLSRLLSLDVFRGLTIALMILVNSPGNSRVYGWLEHSSWHGCTLADLVFPFFIFIVGASIVLSLTKARGAGQLSQGQLIAKIFKRSLLIFFLGLLLNAFPYHFDLATLRVFGVLQRIALCYFFASLLFLTTEVGMQALILVTLLIAYWLIMTLVAVPGYGLNQFTEEGNIAAYIDRMLFGSAHLYGKAYDPEGLLSTLPSIATALMGNLTGIWLMSVTSPVKKLRGMLGAGFAVLLMGGLWGIGFPINKALWTSSYVLWTGGLALLCLAFCYWSIEIKGWKRWGKPFEILGLNAMLAYLLHIFFLKVQAMITVVHTDGTVKNLKLSITEYFFSWASLESASLLYALSYTLFWLSILAVFYHKKIFIKL